MASKHEFINKNISVLHRLFRSGDINGKVMAEYKIYQIYKGYSSVSSKMERYQFVADDARTSVQIVMRAVKNMESSI